MYEGGAGRGGRELLLVSSKYLFFFCLVWKRLIECEKVNVMCEGGGREAKGRMGRGEACERLFEREGKGREGAQGWRAFFCLCLCLCLTGGMCSCSYGWEYIALLSNSH